MKRQPMEQEEILASDVTNNGLISKISWHCSIQKNKTQTQSENGQNTQIDTFPQKDIQMDNRHMKRC